MVLFVVTSRCQVGAHFWTFHANSSTRVEAQTLRDEGDTSQSGYFGVQETSKTGARITRSESDFLEKRQQHRQERKLSTRSRHLVVVAFDGRCDTEGTHFTPTKNSSKLLFPPSFLLQKIQIIFWVSPLWYSSLIFQRSGPGTDPNDGHPSRQKLIWKIEMEKMAIGF